MFNIPGYDQWKLATPPRLDDVRDPDEDDDPDDTDIHEDSSGGGPVG